MRVFGVLFADADGWDHHMWGGGWWMLIWGTFMMIGAVVFVAWLLRSTAAAPGGRVDSARADPLGAARQILAERYARGDITTEEYEERLERLR